MRPGAPQNELFRGDEVRRVPGHSLGQDCSTSMDDQAERIREVNIA
ncbi:hypothetical protein P3T40_007417 [Paraburkholderia sp. EB58]|jgi:hypothetical protein